MEIQARSDPWHRHLGRAVLILAFLSSAVGLSGRMPRVLIIRRVAVFDSRRGEMLPGRTVVIRGDVISEIGLPESLVRAPRGKVIDGRGKYLIPGLIDAHVHLVHVLDFAHVTGDEVLPLFLANGVTSVRDTGDSMVAEKLVARYAEAHPEACPRVFLCSPLLDCDPPFHHDVGLPVTRLEAIPGLMDDFASWGVVTLKIYVGIDRPIGRRIIEEGHRRGMVVAGHLGRYRAQDAVADGIDSLEHIWSVFDFIFPPGDPAIDTSALERRAHADLDTPAARDLIAAIRRHGTAVDPTLAVFRSLLLADLPEVRYDPDNSHVPERLRDYWAKFLASQVSNGQFTAQNLTLREMEFQKYEDLTGILYHSGVTLLAGTDSPEPFCPPGYALQRELQLLVESGLPPAAALQAATLQNARILKMEAKLGSVEPGKLADLLLLDADPLVNIGNTRRISAIIKGGRLCNPAVLLERVPAR